MTKPDTWFVEFRQEWILETLRVFGFFNRTHIVKKFRISKPQASIDIRLFLQRNPHACRYNGSAKQYELVTEQVDK